jgi:hypothetical protein
MKKWRDRIYKNARTGKENVKVKERDFDTMRNSITYFPSG